MTERVAAILMAAGESTRMGRPKPLLPWNGETLLEWQVDQLRAAGVDDVVVVLGHAADEVRRSVPGLRARVVVNESYREGRASSLRAGAEALSEDVEAVLVLSVDQPRPAWVSRSLITAWREGRRPALVLPAFKGHAGHPVLVDGRLIAELRSVKEELLGLRSVVEKFREKGIVIEVPNVIVNIDLNFYRDYEEALAQYKKGDWDRHS